MKVFGYFYGPIFIAFGLGGFLEHFTNFYYYNLIYLLFGFLLIAIGIIVNNDTGERR